jgi:hypothetical protein
VNNLEPMQLRLLLGGRRRRLETGKSYDRRRQSNHDNPQAIGAVCGLRVGPRGAGAATQRGTAFSL